MFLLQPIWFSLSFIFYLFTFVHLVVAGVKVKTEPGFEDSDSDDCSTQGKWRVAIEMLPVVTNPILSQY